jgi:hypothetical protein
MRFDCFAQLDVLVLARVTIRAHSLELFDGGGNAVVGLVRHVSDVRAQDLVPLCCKLFLGLRSVRLVVLDRGDHRKVHTSRALGGGGVLVERRLFADGSLSSKSREVSKATLSTSGSCRARCSSVKRAEEDVNVPRVAPVSSLRTVVRSAASAGVVAGAAGSTHAWLSHFKFSWAGGGCCWVLHATAFRTTVWLRFGSYLKDSALKWWYANLGRDPAAGSLPFGRNMRSMLARCTASRESPNSCGMLRSSTCSLPYTALHHECVQEQ